MFSFFLSLSLCWCSIVTASVSIMDGRSSAITRCSLLEYLKCASHCILVLPCSNPTLIACCSIIKSLWSIGLYPRRRDIACCIENLDFISQMMSVSSLHLFLTILCHQSTAVNIHRWKLFVFEVRWSFSSHTSNFELNQNEVTVSIVFVRKIEEKCLYSLSFSRWIWTSRWISFGGVIIWRSLVRSNQSIVQLRRFSKCL